MVAFEDSELKEKLKAEQTHRSHLKKMMNEIRDKLRNLEVSQDETAITLREETVPAVEDLIIAPGAVVSNECGLKGKITIGANNVIHPRASIVAECGPIIIGDNNVIEADVLIYNAGCQTCEEKTMVIGNNNVLNVGAHVESLKIGNNNVLGVNCYIGRCTELTNNIVVGAKCQVDYDGVIKPNTVIANCE